METKICNKCNKEKPISEFSKSRYHKSGLQSRCKKCACNYMYKRNKWIDDIKMESGCVICGYKEHPAALVFHHKNSKEKSFEIANRKKTPRVMEEISKCRVLCFNCHAITHCKK